MEAHEGILQRVRELALDRLLVHVLRDGVVDVEQGHHVVRDAGADVLGKRSVDIDFAGDRDSAACQAAVDVAGNKSELCLERRPAFACDRDIFAVALVSLDPVKQGQLVLRQLRQDLRDLVARTELRRHIRDDLRDARIVSVLVVSLEEVKFGVLLYLDAHVVELLDRRVAGQEIHRSRPEGNNLEIMQPLDRPRDRQEAVDHVRAVLRVADRVFRDVGLDVPQLQVVAGVQHAAVSVAASADEVVLALFRCCAEHHRAIAPVLREQGLGDLRSEVAEEYAERVAARRVHVRERVHHVDLALDDRDRALVDVFRAVLFRVGFDQRLAAGLGERCREAVTAHSDDTDFNLGNIVHV